MHSQSHPTVDAECAEADEKLAAHKAHNGIGLPIWVAAMNVLLLTDYGNDTLNQSSQTALRERLVAAGVGHATFLDGAVEFKFAKKERGWTAQASWSAWPIYVAHEKQGMLPRYSSVVLHGMPRQVMGESPAYTGWRIGPGNLSVLMAILRVGRRVWLYEANVDELIEVKIGGMGRGSLFIYEGERHTRQGDQPAKYGFVVDTEVIETEGVE